MQRTIAMILALGLAAVLLAGCRRQSGTPSGPDQSAVTQEESAVLPAIEPVTPSPAATVPPTPEPAVTTPWPTKDHPGHTEADIESAIAVVQAYHDAWNNKDAVAMYALRGFELTLAEIPETTRYLVQGTDYVEVYRIYYDESKDRNYAPYVGDRHVYDRIIVLIDFAVFITDEQAEIEGGYTIEGYDANDPYEGMAFSLLREGPDDPWIICGYGIALN